MRAIFLLTIFVFVIASAGYAQQRGIQISYKAREAADAPVAGSVNLYPKSYALIIGNDQYSNGWSRLSNGVKDAREVAKALQGVGFQVTLKTNLKRQNFARSIEDWVFEHGRDRDARLFIWYAGHGHTDSLGEGYLVPVDAPSPAADDYEFKRYALNMRRFGEWVRGARSNHIYAVFDSCFAGTVFESARAAPPPAITLATTKPVRQFLTSGDADQTVSDDGTFRRLFLEALKGERRADANGDGYLTASELGLFMGDRITNYSNGRQTPRHGKLNDPNFDQGDFVFAQLGRTVASGPNRAPAVAPTGPSADMILEVQQGLNKMGYRVAENGLLDARTIAQVKRFEAAHDMDQLGIIDDLFLIEFRAIYARAGSNKNVAHTSRPSASISIATPYTLASEETFGWKRYDVLTSATTAADGSIWYVGDTWTEQAPRGKDQEGWILKFSKGGQKLWEKSYPGRNNWLRDVVAAPDGGAWVAGSTTLEGTYDGWIMRVDGNGHVLWSKVLGGGGEDSIQALARTPDAGLIAVGRTRSKGAGETDIWLLKFNQDGTLLWEKTLGDRWRDAAYDVTVADNGSIWVAGSKKSDAENKDGWVARLSNQGDVLWQQTYSYSAFDQFKSLAISPDGQIWLAGYTNAGTISKTDAWLVRISPDGKVLQNETFGSTAGDSIDSIALMSDGGAMLAGTKSAQGFLDPSKGWVLRLDATGKIVWEQEYGGAKTNELHALLMAPNGQLFAVGNTTSKGAGYRDGWLLKLNPPASR